MAISGCVHLLKCLSTLRSILHDQTIMILCPFLSSALVYSPWTLTGWMISSVLRFRDVCFSGVPARLETVTFQEVLVWNVLDPWADFMLELHVVKGIQLGASLIRCLTLLVLKSLSSFGSIGCLIHC